MRDAAFMESVHAHEKALSFHDTADPFLVKAVSHHEIAVIVSKTRKNMNRGPKNGPKWGAIGEPKMTIMSGTVKEKDRHYNELWGLIVTDNYDGAYSMAFKRPAVRSRLSPPKTSRTMWGSLQNNSSAAIPFSAQKHNESREDVEKFRDSPGFFA